MLYRSNPKISVVIPVYNVAKYLTECINSLLLQTFTDIEIILIDDESTDGSSMICDSFAQVDNRVKVEHIVHSGAAVARNTGISIARGEYLTFVDGDDYISNNMYEIMLGEITRSNADIVICDYVEINECGECILNSSRKVMPYIEYSKDEFVDEFTKPYSSELYITLWNKLCKRSLFQNITFPAGKYYEDEFIIHPILLRCHKILTIGDKLYFYRKRVGSLTSIKYDPHILDYGEALIDRYEAAKANKYSLWASVCAQQIAGEIPQWLKYSKENKIIEQQFIVLCRKSSFLLWRFQPWSGFSLFSRLFFKMVIMIPYPFIIWQNYKIKKNK